MMMMMMMVMMMMMIIIRDIDPQCLRSCVLESTGAVGEKRPPSKLTTKSSFVMRVEN